jgi:hypothetical protein
LRGFELELAVVHDPAHRWIRGSRYFDKVEVQISGYLQRFVKRADAELFPVGVDETNFASSDAIIDPWLVGGGRCGDGLTLLVWLIVGYAQEQKNAGVRKQRPRVRLFNLDAGSGRWGSRPLSFSWTTAPKGRR